MTKDKNEWPQVGDVIESLKYYNQWARGDVELHMPNPKKLGLNIDAAIHYLKRDFLITRYLAAIKKHNDNVKPLRNDYYFQHYWDYDLCTAEIDDGEDVSCRSKPRAWDVRLRASLLILEEFTDAEMKLILTGEE